MANKSNKVYFKGLHALRFFAAALVLISHVEMVKAALKVNNIYADETFWSRSLERLGPLGVTFFFVLSGFLITFLLLTEKKSTKTISIKSFYLRRALRIWPVYFLFVILAFFILPQLDWFYHYYETPLLVENKSIKLLFHIVFIPGMVLALYQSIPWAGHLWSIGVEEQFYLVWPWFFKLRNKLNAHFFIKLALYIILIKALVLVFFKMGYLPNWLKEIAAQSKFECMVIGGYGAFIKFHNKRKLHLFWNSKYGTLFNLLSIFAIVILIPDALDDITHLLLAPLFIVLIMQVIESKANWFENKSFIFLGNISYGFYVFHMACLVLLIKLMPNAINSWCANNNSGAFVINLIYYLGGVLTTVFISGLSYQILEQPFLKLKTKFAIIKSGK